jgi:PIN domain nuclease of toxin-antitoxin system
MRLLLDTMVLIWADQRPARLSRRAARAIRTSGRSLLVSALSLSEIIKNRSGKLNVPEAELRSVLEDLDIRILPYTEEHAWRLFGLGWQHTDPFDHQILAQAPAEDTPSSRVTKSLLRTLGFG